MNENTLKEIVRRCYLQYLNREPDDAGLKHYVHLIQTSQINEKSLIPYIYDCQSKLLKNIQSKSKLEFLGN